MLNSKIKQLVDEGIAIFSKKEQLNTFWQAVANNFYPQRAFFTVSTPFPYGRDFASNLTTSYPLLVARDLANAISSFLRPRGQEWFKMTISNKSREKKLDNEGKKFLEWATTQQMNYLYDRKSGFVKATKEGDYDYAVFGQCAISVEIDWKTKNIIHRCWLLKYLAWTEDYAGNIDKIYHKPMLTIRQAYYLFGDKLHKTMKEKRLTSEGDNAAELIRVVMKTEDYYSTFSDTATKDRKIKLPYVSVYVDIQNDHEIEVEGSPTMIYCIPRWQTVSGSQYAYSPAVIAALPDARLIQAMTLSLLEAGEKAVNPPILAKQDAVRSDIGLYANSVSWVAETYDGPVDEAIHMMQIDRSGLQYGLALQQQTQTIIKEAFYLNKLNLPIFDSKMTATEVTQRVQEYIRNALPLFEPMETEYNQQLMMMDFETLKHVEAFGALEMWPDSLKLFTEKGQEEEKIEFTFSNPLIEARGREKGQKFLEMKAAIAESVALDPTTIHVPNAMVALRDSLTGIGIPAEWMRDEDVVAGMVEQEQQQQQAQQVIQQLAAGGAAAESIGKGAQAVQQAGII